MIVIITLVSFFLIGMTFGIWYHIRVSKYINREQESLEKMARDQDENLTPKELRNIKPYHQEFVG